MREKEKETTIDLEIMLSIKNEFPKLMDFYKFAGLKMSRQDFYAVIRRDECHADNVRAVELGINQARQVRDMTVEDMLKVICKASKDFNNQKVSRFVVYSLRVIVAGVLYIGKQ